MLPDPGDPGRGAGRHRPDHPQLGAQPAGSGAAEHSPNARRRRQAAGFYRLAGVDAGWQPAPKNERESRPIIAAYRILAEGQVQSLEEAHRRIAYLESLLNDRYGHPAATATATATGRRRPPAKPDGPGTGNCGCGRTFQPEQHSGSTAKPDGPSTGECGCGRTFQPERHSGSTAKPHGPGTGDCGCG